MKQIMAECESLHLLVLRTLADRGHYELNSDTLFAAPNHYCVEEDGIVTLSEGQQVANVGLRVLSQTCWFGEAGYAPLQEKLRRLRSVLTSAGIHCYSYQRGQDEWAVYLDLGVSLQKSQARYLLKAVSHSDAYHPDRNEVFLEVAVYARRIDAEVVSNVQMVDEILHGLMTSLPQNRSSLKRPFWPIRLRRARSENC